MAILLVPKDGSTPIKFDRPILIVGRHPDCDIILTNSRKVSRKHCCLALVNNRLLVRDLGSMNGLRVNGKDVSHESPIQVGDTLQVGDVEFKVEVVADVKKQPKISSPPKQAEKNGSSLGAKNQELPHGVDPHMLSMDFPIALPEKGEDDSEEYIIPPLVD